MAQDRDLLKALVNEALDQVLQAEMTEFLGAAPGERNAERMGYRAGYIKS
jgi:transposase-like protein